MQEYRFSVTCILPYKGRIYDSVTRTIQWLGRIRVSETPYFRIFYAMKKEFKKLQDYVLD